MTPTLQRRALRMPVPRASAPRRRLPFGLALVGVALAGPAAAQSPTGIAGPWSGISILVTPPSSEAEAAPSPAPSPYDAAVAEASPAASEPDDTADPAAEPAIEGRLVDPVATAPKASLWASLGAGPAPALPEGTPAPYSRLPSRSPDPAKAGKLPTSVDLREGPASLSVSTSASATAPSSGALASSAGGGTGEIKGRVGYEQDNLAVYSTGAVGASASTGLPSVYDNVAVGSSYSVPLAPLGLGADTLGAKVEVNSAAAVTTGVELRADADGYQRFISVQRSATPDAPASGIVKAGVLGKF